MEKRFRALRIIGTIYKVLGYIFAVATILTALALCATSVLGGAAMENFGREFGTDMGFGGLFSGLLGGLMLGLGALLYGGLMTLTFLAMGEGVYLLISLEEHTRTTAMLLRGKSDLFEG